MKNKKITDEDVQEAWKKYLKLREKYWETWKKYQEVVRLKDEK